MTPPNPVTLDGVVDDTLTASDAVDDITDPYERIRAAWALRDAVTRNMKEVVRDTLQGLVDDRYTLTEIAANLGLTKQRIGQIIDGK